MIFICGQSMYKSSKGDHRAHTISGGDYSRDEVTNIQEKLSRQLGPEFISKRKGPGFSSVQYLEGWKAINLANEIFGFDGWSTEVKEFKVDYIDERQGIVSIGLSCTVRVIVKSGAFREDVGYGSIDNCKNKAMAFDKCKKEAVTDGMKRALRQFGNALGNCLYDKDFLQHVTRVAAEPRAFDASLLMRNNTKDNEDNKQSTNGNSIINNNNNNKVQQSRVLQQNEQIKNAGKERVNEIERSVNVENDVEFNNDDDNDNDSFLFSDDWPEDNENNNTVNNNNSNNIKNNNNINNNGYANKTNNNEKIDNLPPSPQQVKVPDQVVFVQASAASSIQKDPLLQSKMTYTLKPLSLSSSTTPTIDQSKSVPIKKPVNLAVAPSRDPLTKRAFGVPPNMLTSKRLRK